MINIYQIADSAFQQISAGTFEHPVSMNVTPAGRAYVKKLFLRNDDSDFWYDEIEIKPVSLLGSDISDGSISIKLISGESKPKEAQWNAAPNNSLSVLSSPVEGPNKTTRVPELGSPGVPDLKYYPFWIRVEGSKGLPIGSARFSLSVAYTENAI